MTAPKGTSSDKKSQKIIVSAQRALKIESQAVMDLVDRIDEVLPQTQCEKSGYAGCRPYAEALVEGDDINKCPPGGNETILALSLSLIHI